MTKLHELLAVETSLENQANKVRADLSNTFEKKKHLFEEKRTTFTPLAEGQPETVESQSEIQTTVRKELAWISGHLTKFWDASLQVAEANTRARADVVLEDGTILLKGVPATALLELEKRTAELCSLLQAIPTLDPARGFAPDPARHHVYAAREVAKTRTKKTKQVLVLYPATTEHPAQVTALDVDEPVGKLRELEWSGLITPAEKADLINRAEVLQRAVRSARSRANDAEVDLTVKAGEAMMAYVLKGKQ